MLNDEAQEWRHKLAALRLEHRDLDDVIHQLSNNVYIDQLQMRRFKKRKLFIKDMIDKIESRLIPDLDA